MPLHIAIQMDPLEQIKIHIDTSFALALEAQKRGHRLFFYQPETLVWQHKGEGGVLTAQGHYARLQDKAQGKHIVSAEAAQVELADMDIILMRQDPPFDMAYSSAAYLLAGLPRQVLVINDPSAVLTMPEKIFCTRFAHLMPPTLISADKQALAAFCAEQEEVILKPLYGGAGADILRSHAGDSNFPMLVDFLLTRWRAPVMVQKFLPEIAQGDRRLMLIDGKPAATLNRIPLKGEHRANLAAGGSGTWVELSAHDRAIANEVGPPLAKAGVLLAGLDLIGGWLTEINITSPTGLRVILAGGGPDLAPQFWDVAQAKLAARRVEN